MSKNKVTIGIIGHPASGKDAASDYLVSRGFLKISGGDILREEMTKLGLSVERASVHEFAKEMRKKYGNSYPAEEEVKMSKENDGNSVVIGMRNLEEIRVLREGIGKDFKLIAINAPIEIRYKRAKDRGRIGDDISFEQFKKEEEKEKLDLSGSHEVDKVILTADVVIENDDTLEDLYKKIDEVC